LSVLVSLAIAQSAIAQTVNRSSDKAAIRFAITAMTEAFNAQDTQAWVVRSMLSICTIAPS
jgi:hypothetical protein